MLTNFSNAFYKHIAPSTKSFGAADSCCNTNQNCLGWFQGTETINHSNGAVCVRDYKAPNCNPSGGVWLGSEYNCQMPAQEPSTSPASSGGGGGGGGVPVALPSTGEPMTTSEFVLQQDPAYYGQSGSNPAVYPAVGTTTPITPTGASAWVTDYNSVGFMPNDPIMGGSYSAPVGDLFSTDQGTNPASEVGIAFPLQQSIYDIYSNVTGAGISSDVHTTDFGVSNAATRVTTDTIANPVTLPTTLSTWDLFGTAGASSGLYLDTPVIKQNAVATTPTAETPKIGGLGWLAGGFIALKLLAVI